MSQDILLEQAAELEAWINDFVKSPLTGLVDSKVENTLKMLQKVLTVLYNDNSGLDCININVSCDDNTYTFQIRKTPKIRMGFKPTLKVKMNTVRPITKQTHNGVSSPFITPNNESVCFDPTAPLPAYGEQSSPINIPRPKVIKRIPKSNLKGKKGKKNKILHKDMAVDVTESNETSE